MKTTGEQHHSTPSCCSGESSWRARPTRCLQSTRQSCSDDTALITLHHQGSCFQQELTARVPSATASTTEVLTPDTALVLPVFISIVTSATLLR